MDNSTNLATTMDLFLVRLQKSGRLVDKYYTPVLCSLGVLGNILSLIVFSHDSKFKSQSSSYYLAALAISDTGFLINLLIFWLEDVLNVGIITNPVMCPLVMYLGQVTCFISVYLMIAFSVERFVAVEYPFSRLKYCTTEVSRKVTFIIVSVALVMFSYVWLIAQVIVKKLPNTNSTNLNLSQFNISTDSPPFSSIMELLNSTSEKPSEPDLYRCSVPKRFYNISEIANYLDTVLTLIFPVILIACLNVRICYSVGNILKERKLIVAAGARMMPILKVAADGRMIQSQSSPVTDNQTSEGKIGQTLMKTPGENDANVQKMSQTCQTMKEPGREKKHDAYLEMKVTKTLLVVSTVFVCLHLPLHTIRCAQFITYMRDISTGKMLLRALEPWGNLLFNTNFAVNFILYYTSGRNFRETLKQLAPFRRFQRKQQPCVTESHYRTSYRDYTMKLTTLNVKTSVEGNSFNCMHKNMYCAGLDEYAIQNGHSNLTLSIMCETKKKYGEATNI